MMDKKSKFGFTLVELMVVMLFVTLVIAATAPIITKRIKEVPRKLQHGKYICYRNDETGDLVEAYYNSSKFTHSNEGIDKCTFTPPVKATLFRIELIGAGAGGYDYAKVVDEDGNYEGAYLTAEGTLTETSKIIKEPTGYELYNLLYGANFAHSVNTGRAGNGGHLYVFAAKTEGIDYTLNACKDGKEESKECKDAKKDLEKDKVIKKIRNNLEHKKGDEKNRKGDFICKGLIEVEDAEGNSITVWNEQEQLIPEYDEGNELFDKNEYSACLGHMGWDNVRKNFYNYFFDKYFDGYYDGYKKDYGIKITNSNEPESIKMTASQGGGSKFLRYEGTIDFRIDKSGSTIQAPAQNDESDETVKNYLKELLSGTKYVERGSVPDGSGNTCEGFSQVIPSDGANAIPTEWHSNYNGNYDNTKKHVVTGFNEKFHADDGGIPNRFAAIRFFGTPNMCIKTTSKPTPGKGVRAVIRPYQIWYKQTCILYDSTKEWKNPDTVFGNPDVCFMNGKAIEDTDYVTSSVPSESIVSVNSQDRRLIPNVQIKSTINKRVHTVGYGGKAGKTAVYYTTALGSDCEFNVPAGGGIVSGKNPPGDDIQTQMQENLATSISCNEKTWNRRVDGGSYDYNKLTKIYEPTFSNRKLVTGTGPYITVAEGDASTFRSADDMFTRYNITNRYSFFGAAGNGAKITDRCIQHHGEYTQQVKYSEVTGTYAGGFTSTVIWGKKGATYKYNPYEDNEGAACEDYDIEHATPGRSGAVIISW